MDRLHTGAVSPEVAIVADVFDQFCAATTFKNILGLHRNMCEVLHLYPTNLPHFYPKLKAKLRSWKAQALWKRLDARIGHKCYARGKACPNNRVLIIGAGPCGLRAAIEAQLLGAKVVVLEKRDRITRNNVLHLWPFVIQDLRALGAKKFFGKFCAGSIDHISIRQLQCILLKVALLLGVELHEGVSFESLIPPSDSNAPDSMGWHAAVTPADHPVSQYEFDVLIGADGKRNTLDGFKRKEFRGKLAIAITANFINKRSEAEARVEEISGVAFIFNQKFFKDLYQETGIDLENIVYYKDDTHYFVMTAKKHSLIEKGVIMEDLPDTARLLAPDNVDREALMEYAREAAEFSTEYQMPNMEFAVNHYGQPDVAMFDFTSMYAAENASRILEQHGHKLLMCLVGDSLLEPFWPTGSGCARGFLSSFDACWAIRSWGSSQHPLEVLAERESIYRLLAQTTPENLQRDCASYTLDPATRYPNLNRYIVLPAQVKSLFQTDDPSHIEIPNVPSLPNDKNNALIEIHKKRRRRDTQVHPDTLLHWLKRQVSLYNNVTVDNLTTSFKNGMAFCAIIHRYRPDLIDFTSLLPENAATNNQLAFDVLEREQGILPVMSGEEMAQGDVPDKLAMLTYLSQIYDAFRGEIPHVKHPKLELPEIKKTDRLPLNAESMGKTRASVTPTGTAQRISGRHKRHAELMSGTVGVGTTGTERRRKRRSADKFGQNEERQKRLEEIASNRIERMSRRKLHRKNATENFYKSIYMLQTNTKHDEDGPFEDYSIYLYRQTAPNFDDRVKNLEQKLLYPDRESHFPGGNRRGSHDEDFTGRIKHIEDKLKGSAAAVDKKPRDLLRAIGKIESSDWNIKEIEKKIQENKMGKSSSHEKERVPKWSREQFLARQTKMEKKAVLDRQDSETAKYSEIDSSLKKLDQKLKEGTVLEPGARGNNKVAVMAEQFAKQPEPEPKVTVQRSTSKAAIVLPKQGGSESCHFCGDRVYLMERLSAEGKFFHRGCFRCQYCSTALRLGSYAYDKEGIHGYKFYCSQHFGLQGNVKVSRSPPKYQERSKDHKNDIKSPDKSLGVAGLDLLDRGQTPERIDLVAGEKEEMDEDEWTDRNFGQSAAEADSDDSSDLSDSDSDDVYEEALEQGLEADFTEGTLRLADSWQRKYSARQDDDSGSEYDSGSDAFSYYDYSSEDDASDTATEGEDDIRARELRQQEVRVQAPVMVPDTDTGSDTEVKGLSVGIEPNLEPISELSSLPNIVNSDLSNDSQINVNNSDNKPDLLQTGFVDSIARNDSEPTLSTLAAINSVENTDNSDIHLDVKPVSLSSIISEQPMSMTSDIDVTETKNEIATLFNDLDKILSEVVNVDGTLKSTENLLEACDLTSSVVSNKETPPENLPVTELDNKENLNLNIIQNNSSPKNSDDNKLSNSKDDVCRKSNESLKKILNKENEINSGKSDDSVHKNGSSNGILVTPKEMSKLFNRRRSSASTIENCTPLKVKTQIDLETTRKYFGVDANASKSKTTFNKKIIPAKAKLDVNKINEKKFDVKQEGNRTDESNDSKIGNGEEKKPEEKKYSFEPKDDDLEDLDKYMETLLASEDKLLIPIPIPSDEPIVEDIPEPEIIQEETADGPLSESIEDLLKALEIETEISSQLESQPSEKIDDLLSWISELDYQPTDKKLYRSYSAVKYKNLEHVLKTPRRKTTVINKIPKDNINYFERQLSGITTDADDFESTKNNLQRSKTHANCYGSEGRRDSIVKDLSQIFDKSDIRKTSVNYDKLDLISLQEKIGSVKQDKSIETVPMLPRKQKAVLNDVDKNKFSETAPVTLSNLNDAGKNSRFSEPISVALSNLDNKSPAEKTSDSHEALFSKPTEPIYSQVNLNTKKNRRLLNLDDSLKVDSNQQTLIENQQVSSIDLPVRPARQKSRESDKLDLEHPPVKPVRKKSSNPSSPTMNDIRNKFFADNSALPPKMSMSPNNTLDKELTIKNNIDSKIKQTESCKTNDSLSKTKTDKQHSKKHVVDNTSSQNEEGSKSKSNKSKDKNKDCVVQ